MVPLQALNLSQSLVSKPMRHLAIESSGTAGSIALSEHSPEVPFLSCDEIELTQGIGSVQTLAPAISALLKRHGIRVDQLGLISVTSGPGSFTGLRVGLATAQALSLSTEIPIAPVDTLEAVALRFARAVNDSDSTASGRLVTILNAFRKQVFTAAWSFAGGDIVRCSTSQVVDISRWTSDPWNSTTESSSAQFDELSKELNASNLFVSGPGLAVAVPNEPTIQIAPQSRRDPMAREVGELGRRMFLESRTLDALSLRPVYIRASAAEERRSTP